MNKGNQLAAAMVFVLTVTSGTAVAAKADISGAWIITVDLISNKATIEATIKQNDDKITTEIMTPAGALDFTGTLVDNKISAVYVLRVQGNSREIRMNGIVDADTLSGTIEFAPGQEAKWTAVRKPVIAASETAEDTPSQDSTPALTPEATK